jgi:uncharacterized membrane protein YedE/YeeE
MENFSPIASLGGGILIGLAAALFMLMTGRICGVSGIYGGLLHFKRGDSLWRFLFIAGLITGGGVSLMLFPEVGNIQIRHSPTLLIAAGLLVGVGVRLGSGCTSGHGVCGVGRLAPRSLVACAVFVATGILTATFLTSLLV